MYPSHCNFTLHEYQFQQYLDFTAEKATEKGSEKGKSNTSYLIYLFKLHHFFSTFYIIIYTFYEMFSTNNMYNSQSEFNSFHISLEDHTSITDLICVCHFLF